MTEFDPTALRDAVAGLSWRFAKTMPDAPHWYIVRNPEIEDIYVTLFKAVRAHGTFAMFTPPDGRRPYRQQYLRLGDGFKYWVMTADINASRIINRADENDGLSR